MQIILISGKARSGKDTFAEMLKSSLPIGKTLTIHYADYVKYSLMKYFNWNGKKDLEGRTMLQTYATDYVRKKNPLFWVEIVYNFIEITKDKWDYVIIPDTRFLNEISFWENKKDYKICSINIVREKVSGNKLSVSQQQHISENELNYYHFDYQIKNDGSFKDLEKEAKKIIEELKKC